MKTRIQQAIYIFAATFSLIIVSACTNTKITSVWMDQKKAGTSFNDIMVIGIA